MGSNGELCSLYRGNANRDLFAYGWVVVLTFKELDKYLLSKQGTTYD